MPATFTCFTCHEVYELGPEEDAAKEYQDNFPDAVWEERGGPICTKCYNEFWKWAEDNAPELTRKL